MFTKRSRGKKGVGSIIGAVFVILILLSGFTFYEVALKNMNSYTAVIDSMNQADMNTSHEELRINSIQISSNNELNMTVQNIGSVPSIILWIGIFNQSMNPEGQWYFSVSQQIAAGQTLCNFTSPFTVTRGQQYTVQLVTQNGNVFDYTLYPASQANLHLTLMAGSPTVYQGNNVTMFLTVTNNNANIAVQNIEVSLVAVPSNLTLALVFPVSLTINTLGAGASAFFTWTYKATNIGTVLFKATYNQAPQGAFTTSSVSILAVPTAAVNQGQVIITDANATGTVIQFGAWQNYIITSTSTSGAPTPYAYVSIYANGTSVNFENALDNSSINDPAWVQLDSKGTYQLKLQATSSSSQTFTIFASVGTTVGQKSILQEAP